jgi:vacuolar-type H+-ATPase subunit C/Vma6
MCNESDREFDLYLPFLREFEETREYQIFIEALEAELLFALQSSPNRTEPESWCLIALMDQTQAARQNLIQIIKLGINSRGETK